jgi:hypothetical protein
VTRRGGYGLDPQELIARYPRLYHMAVDASWPSIERHGLLSTTALLDLYEVTGRERAAIEFERRPECVVLHHPVHGRAVVRDNKPLLEARLAGCLEHGLTPPDWYRLLNRQVFFWPTQARLETLMHAEAYRALPKLVVTVDTEALLVRDGNRITLSPINSGATRPFARPRGTKTFRTLDDFDWEARRKYGKGAVAEVAVDYAVPDIVEVAESAVRHPPDGETELLWHRDG